MLIDRGHRRWIVVTALAAAAAVGLQAWFGRRTPHGWSGGSTAGLWFGVAGSLLMLFAGSLSALRRVPAWWWLGPRKLWLKGHIWLGLLSVVVIAGHAGYRWGGPLEQALWVVLGAVVLSGVFGLALQQFLPGLLTRRAASEAPYEQIPHLCRVLRGRADELVDAVAVLLAEPSDLAADLRAFHERELRPFLAVPAPRGPMSADAARAESVFSQLRRRAGVRGWPDHRAAAEAAFEEVRDRLGVNRPEELARAEDGFKKVRALVELNELKDLAPRARAAFADLAALPAGLGVRDLVNQLGRVCQDRWLTELEAVCGERRGYAEQERVHHWLHGWLLVHVPLSAALLILGTAHAVMSLYY